MYPVFAHYGAWEFHEWHTGTLVATAQTAVQASFGMMPAPLIGAMVAVLGGAIGTLRNS